MRASIAAGRRLTPAASRSQLPRVPADQRGGISERRRRASSSRCRRPRPAVRPRARPRGRRRSRSGSTARAMPCRASRYGSISVTVVTVSMTVKLRDASKRCNQLAAGRGPVAVRDHDRHVLDVGRRGITEHGQLQDRRDDHDPEQARVHAAARETPSRSARAGAACSGPALLARRSDARPARPSRTAPARRTPAAGADAGLPFSTIAAQRDQEVARRHDAA